MLLLAAACSRSAARKWSDPSTWPGGKIPATGEDVTIPAGNEVLLDVTPPPLGGVMVLGKLTFSEQDLELTAKWIMVHGALQIGTEAKPFPKHATITLTGSDPSEDVMGMGTRGILVMGGVLELHGAAPSPVWTKLSANAPSGTTSLALKDRVNWSSGDQLVIAPTDFYRIGGTELIGLQAATADGVTLASPLQQAHWGVLQYVNSLGITLTPTTSVTEKVIDERAEVGNLTRNIVVRGPDDTLWQNQGFGAQVMFMSGGAAHIEGAQFTRVGQAGLLGRYPLHWHLLSYARDGSEIGDVTGQYVRNSVVWSSSQRCVVIHGTNGLTVQNNICYDIRGHAFFLEDAVERRNVLTGNLALRIRSPRQAQRLLNHELVGFRSGPAGFWLTNPDNTVRGNVAADSEGLGFWLAFPQAPLGASRAVNIQPTHTPFGVCEDNVAHSNQGLGFQLDHAPINDAGDTTDLVYAPVEGGLAPGGDIFAIGVVEKPFTISRITSYKHEHVSATHTSLDEFNADRGALWNRARTSTYADFIVADYNDAGFKGASQLCHITRALVVGATLNNANRPIDALTAARGAASYHSQCDIDHNLFINVPAVPGIDSGAFETFDYYITGVDKGLVRNGANTLINTHPGRRSTSPNLQPVGSGERENFSLSGALWDPYGLWAAPGNYWVYDLPYLTAGTTCTNVRQPVFYNDKSCVGPYYGFDSPHLDGGGEFTAPILYHRNDNGAEWFVDDGNCTWRLPGMRSGAMLKDASYTVTFPAGQRSDDRGTCTPAQLARAAPPPRRLTFAITNLINPNDGFLLAIEYAGNATPTVYRTTWPNPYELVTDQWASWTAWRSGDPAWQTRFRGTFWRPITPVGSVAEVQRSNGDGYWQDRANNLLWILVRSGLQIFPADPNSDQDLYRPTTFVLDNTL